ncbi:MAG: glycosyltransferase family 4 protein [Labilithrix sp.]|nr:glycosyltransferase family 4 protein [Labilithrix sp.]
MRICVVTTSYPARDGDPAGHFVKTEVDELERAGHEVVVVTPRPGGAFGWPGAVARLEERPWRIGGAAAWMALATAKIRRARPQRIVAHWSVPSAWPVVRASNVSGASLEVVSHGADVRLLVALPARVRRSIVAGIAARAASWRFVSESLLEMLEKTLDPRVARDLRAIARIAPAPLGMIDVADDVRAHRSALGARPLYVCAGRLVASKRVDKVIDYVATLRDREHEPVLVVLGDGPERPRLEQLAQRWQIDVRFLGNMPRREALGWIGAADEVVHASVAEGLSTVLREAEHLGVKVTVL